MDFFSKYYNAYKNKEWQAKLCASLAKNNSSKTENILFFLLNDTDMLELYRGWSRDIDHYETLLINLPSKFNNYFDKIFRKLEWLHKMFYFFNDLGPSHNFLDYLYNLEDKSYYEQCYSDAIVSPHQNSSIFAHLEKLGHYDLYNTLFLKLYNSNMWKYINTDILDINGIEHYNNLLSESTDISDIYRMDISEEKKIDFKWLVNNHAYPDNFIDISKLSYDELVKTAEEYDTVLTPIFIELFLKQKQIFERKVEYVTLNMPSGSYNINIQYSGCWSYFCELSLSTVSSHFEEYIGEYLEHRDKLIAQFGTDKILLFSEDLSRFDEYSYPNGIAYNQLVYTTTDTNMKIMPIELENFYYNTKFDNLTIGKICDTICKYPDYKPIIGDIIYKYNSTTLDFENMTEDEFDIMSDCFPHLNYIEYLENIN